MKKIISAVLAVVMLIGITPFSKTAEKILGANEVNALETVKGSFDRLVDYICKNGEYDKEDGTFSLVLSTVLEYDSGGVASIIYNVADNTVVFGLAIISDIYGSPCALVPAVTITEKDNRYLTYAVIYTDYTYLAAYADIDPTKYYLNQKIDFELVSDNTWFWESYLGISDSLNSLIANIIDSFDSYLMRELGFGLGNFGFTNISAPVALPGAKIDSIDVRNFEMNYKGSYKLSPEIKGDDYVDYTVEYKSSDNSVATVDKNGNVYAAGRGAADITCKVTDKSGNVFEDTCTVTVKFSFVQWLIWILLLGFLWY